LAVPDLSSLNPLAILAAAAISAALGAAWYSPLLFGPAWMKALGKTQDQLGPMGAAMAGSVFSCLVAATAVDALLAATGAASLAAGIGMGALLGFGVVAMTTLFSGWGWPLYFIQMSYRATYLVLMGAICGVWRA
jgi:hypothetical protein